MSVDLSSYAHFEGLFFERPVPHVLRITIDNPTQMNALNGPLLKSVHGVWDVLDADPLTRVVIITGAGRSFCAGGAFDAMPDGAQEKGSQFNHDFAEARALVNNIVNCRKPIISAINGPAVGAGLAIALLADISVAGSTAKLFDGHLRIGVAPGDHALLIWPLLCGLAKAKYYLMTNRPVTGQVAEAMNLVSLSVPDEELQQSVLDIAVDLAATAPTALRMTKYLLNSFLRKNQDVFDLSAAFEMINFGSAENQEAMRAYRNRVPPEFDERGSGFW